MVKEYELRTVEDFLYIPKEKIGRCLKDFEIWIRLARTDFGSIMCKDHLVWKDDDMVGLTEIRILEDDE